jgi:dipeptidyl aminopeptidase/acylaminoacyl peptidase
MTKFANAGFIVVIVDGRGTGFKGRAYRACVSKQLGKLEVEDQIFAARYLGGLSFVDEKRIAIWGWSYGGYGLV